MNVDVDMFSGDPRIARVHGILQVAAAANEDPVWMDRVDTEAVKLSAGGLEARPAGALVGRFDDGGAVGVVFFESQV